MALTQAPQPRGGRGVLQHLARVADVELLAVGPGVLPERPSVAQRPLDRPLVHLEHRFHDAVSYALARPGLGRPVAHVGGHVALHPSRVGIDHPAAAPPAAVGGPSVHRRQTHPIGPPVVEPQCPGSGLWRKRHLRRVERRRPRQPIGLGHAGEAPVHHPDAGREPQQEEEAKRHPHPPVQDDQDAQHRTVSLRPGGA